MQQLVYISSYDYKKSLDGRIQTLQPEETHFREMSTPHSPQKRLIYIYIHFDYSIIGSYSPYWALPHHYIGPYAQCRCNYVVLKICIDII